MGKAVSYTLAQWESLEVYLKEPEIEIDNNLVENAMRPTALGKKNWLFFGDADAGERSAIIYSIIESCRRHDIEPYTYLRDVLSRLPTMTNRQIKGRSPAPYVLQHIRCEMWSSHLCGVELVSRWRRGSLDELYAT